MNMRLIGTASAAALLSLGLAACGQDPDYETSQTETTGAYAQDDDTAVAEETPDQSADQQQSRVADSGYATTDTPAASYDPQATTPNAGGLTPAAIEAVAIADIRIESDAERAAETAFGAADANGDGMLDRAEYMTVAISAEPAQSVPGIVDPVDPATGATVAEAPPIDGATPEGDTLVATDPVDPVMVDAAFAAAAGPDGELTEEELRSAFLARFEQADADGDAELSDEERMTFAALTVGEQPTVAPQQ